MSEAEKEVQKIIDESFAKIDKAINSPWAKSEEHTRITPWFRIAAVTGWSWYIFDRTAALNVLSKGALAVAKEYEDYVYFDGHTGYFIPILELTEFREKTSEGFILINNLSHKERDLFFAGEPSNIENLIKRYIFERTPKYFDENGEKIEFDKTLDETIIKEIQNLNERDFDSLIPCEKVEQLIYATKAFKAASIEQRKYVNVDDILCYLYTEQGFGYPPGLYKIGKPLAH